MTPLPRTAGDLASFLGGRLHGDAEAPIHRLVDHAPRAQGELFFAWRAPEEAGGGVLVASQVRIPPGGACIEVAQPRAALARWLGATHPSPRPFIHPTAVLGKGVVLGENTSIGAHCVLADGVVLGGECSLEPGVVLGSGVVLGARVHIGANSVIGAQGFLLAEADDTLPGRPVPHIGGVHVGDDVWIGALVSVASGTLSPTVIGPAARIDNLVHIAHNCRIDAGAVIAAQVGLAGSVHVGPGARLAGQVGVADHGVIGVGATVLAQSGVFRSVPEGATYGGTPARPRREWLRSIARSRRARTSPSIDTELP